MAIYEERGSDWSRQVSAMVTTRWLQCDQTLPLCEGYGLQDYFTSRLLQCSYLASDKNWMQHSLLQLKTLRRSWNESADLYVLIRALFSQISCPLCVQVVGWCFGRFYYFWHQSLH